MGLLDSSHFFIRFAYWSELLMYSPDPHNWIWFIGKLESFIVFPLAFFDVRTLFKDLKKVSLKLKAKPNLILKA